MTRIAVLDHGFVRLVDHMGSDISVVRAARCSYDAAWRAGEDEGSDKRLINFLMKNRHTTPFEAVEFQFEVMAPIFVFRQWHRHRTQSYNELSGRYRELPRAYYLPNAEDVGVQSTNNKQGRLTEGANPALVELRGQELHKIRAHCEAGFDLYDELIRSGWPKELARAHLGVNVYSHMFAKGNLRNWLHFLSLRADPHAQYEIRVYAEAIKSLVAVVAPECMRAFDEHCR